jgi:hypothetical protein
MLAQQSTTLLRRRPHESRDAGNARPRRRVMLLVVSLLYQRYTSRLREA